MIQTRRRIVSQFSIIILLITLIPSIISYPQMNSGSEFINQRSVRSQKFRTCGRNLMNLIQLVCSGSMPGKRSHQVESWTSKEMNPWSQFSKFNHEDVDSESDDFLDTRSALSLFGTHKRSSSNDDSQIFFRNVRGASDECCKKACSFDELRTYCGPAGR